MAYDRNGASGAIPRSVFWLLALWVVVVLAALVWGIDNAESTLRASARASLESSDQNVAVDISGRDARLIGVVESEAIAEELVGTVDAVEGVRLVSNEILVVAPEPPPQRAPELEVRLVGGAISLRGALPSEEVATAIVDAASEAYGSDRVIDALDFDEGVEEEPWLGFLPGVFKHITVLRSGGFTANATGLNITGEVVSDTVGDQLLSQVEVLIGDQIPVSADLTVAILPPPSFAAKRTGGVVVVEGTMPTQDTVDRILEAARRLHPNETVVDALVVGDVAGPMWLESVDGLLDVVSRLEDWTIEVSNGTVSITGFGGDPDVVSAVDVLVAEVVGGELVAITAVEVQPSAVATELTSLLEGTVVFLPGTATLAAEATGLLETAVGILEANPSTVLIVEAHTDNQADAEANRRLSQQRAEAVVAFLVAGGIDAARLAPIGLGEEQPIASNATEEGRAQNRRIVFVIREGDG